MTFVVLSIAAILIKLVGIFSGYTVLYSDTINFVQFVLNVSGSVRLAWFIIFEGACVRACVGEDCLLSNLRFAEPVTFARRTGKE